jgi:hypothetical protein
MDWDSLIQKAIADGRMPLGAMLLIVPKYGQDGELDEEATLKASLLVTNIGESEG